MKRNDHDIEESSHTQTDGGNVNEFTQKRDMGTAQGGIKYHLRFKVRGQAVATVSINRGAKRQETENL